MTTDVMHQMLTELHTIEHLSQRLDAALAAVEAATGPTAPASVRAALSPQLARIRAAIAPTTHRLVELNDALRARAAELLPPATLTPSPSSN